MNGAHRDGEPVFEIGLVMAGAISAGAYTAGVVDFLLQALDEWQKRKDAGEADCPPHAVRLKVLAGASAGGMTAAITAAALGGRIDPVTDPEPAEPTNNALYDSWVRRIDISALLGSEDLKGPDARLRSILDSTELGRIADDALRVEPTGRARPYVADPLHVLLSVANMRGVPYSIDVAGNAAHGHEMSAHADFVHFAFGRAAPGLERVRRLDPQDYDHPNWRHLRDAALASGAFPIGLQPRRLTRPANDYDERWWQIPLVREESDECYTYESIPPKWPPELDAGSYDYDFLCVDGGLMNNEPLEFARRILADWGRNPRAGVAAHRAVVLVDPFPNVAPFKTEYAAEDDLPTVAKAMFGALKRQARFKPDELALAQRQDVYSRFMIAPKRPGADGEPSPFPICSGALGGFGGFLAEAFRAHDFQLGRRNCQRFLQQYFVLPSEGTEENPLFGHWSERARNDHAVDREGRSCLPIIPLCGAAANEVSPPEPSWPQLDKDDLGRLRKGVKARANAVVRQAVRDYGPGGGLGSVVKVGARLGWTLKGGKAVDRIMQWIAEDLKERGQLAPSDGAASHGPTPHGRPGPNGPGR